MGIEQREGIVDRLTEKGVVLSGTRLSYSKWFEGERLTESSLGHKVTVLVDAGEKCTFLKKVLETGEKVPGWKQPAESPNGSWGGGGRRLSPEELDLKRAEGVRIARCCAVERAVDMAERGVTVEKIASYAPTLEEYFLTGKLPGRALPPAKGAPKEVPLDPPGGKSQGGPPNGEPPVDAAPPSPLKAPTEAPRPPAKPKRLESRAVNALFNEAKRARLVADWKDYESLIRKVLGAEVKTAYHLSPPDFAKIESALRSRIKAAKVA